MCAVSRDGGLTWSMARAGSHIYEYGDHGAILVIADDRRASTEVNALWPFECASLSAPSRLSLSPSLSLYHFLN